MRVFTSEAVTVGHPDKICDQIADAILVECLAKDPNSHVACEVCCTTGTVILMGEITTNASINYKEIARNVLYKIGYTDVDYGIDYRSCSILDLIDKQSLEINCAVYKSLESKVGYHGDTYIDNIDSYDMQGAGDQGIIFGYACNETKELMPLSHMIAHDLASKLYEVRVNEILPWLRPDGKTQVSLSYNDNGKIEGIDTVLVSTQHKPGISKREIYESIREKVIDPVLNKRGFINKCRNYLINPSGSFTVGGPQGDTGLTGRKLAVDTYGGHAKFGGGAMCGKDPSKVDRSAAYMARYIAKHIVAAQYSSVCEVQISYGIGVARPLSVWVDTKGTSNLPDSLITKFVTETFDMRPAAIIDKLDLKSFNYNLISGHCQFGNNYCPWEKLDTNLLEVLYNLKNDYLTFKM